MTQPLGNGKGRWAIPTVTEVIAIGTTKSATDNGVFVQQYSVQSGEVAVRKKPDSSIDIFVAT